MMDECILVGQMKINAFVLIYKNAGPNICLHFVMCFVLFFSSSLVSWARELGKVVVEEAL